MNRLVTIHDTIRSKIVALRMPTVAEMLPGAIPPAMSPTDQPRYWRLNPSAWQTGQRLCGAVELYSTTDSISPYPDPEPAPPNPADFPVPPTVPEHVPPPNPNAPNPPSPPPPAPNFKEAFDAYGANLKADYYWRFAARHAARSLQAQKVVYNAVGLGSLWVAINRLRLIAGEPPLTVGDPAEAQTVRDGVWSVREFSERVGAAVGSVPVGNLMLPATAIPLTIRSLGTLFGIPAAAIGSLRQVMLDESGRVP